MNININMNKNYSTANFYLAVFLLTRGLNITKIDRSNFRHSQFIFEKSPRWEHLAEVFSYAKNNDSEVMVDARKFIIAVKNLKEKLYSGI